MSAVISSCGKYRYWLSREGDATKQPVAFVMLNPSTADADKDDATIRRCRSFARGAPFVVVNLCAYRATKPAGMIAQLTDNDAFGPVNETYLRWVAEGNYKVIFAWGDIQDLRLVSIARYVTLLFKAASCRPYCLGTTKARGWPRHPLYVKGDQPLVDYLP